MLACLRYWEDLVDVADRDVARVGAVRVSATAKIDRELEHGHVEGEVPLSSRRVARAKTARAKNGHALSICAKRPLPRDLP